ncbi:B12-binding domain-containing radical SAM protein [Roseivirga pacifica]|uniref:B12-binding domain-containing radical SAM protein n=1 Tax=Roseivirga pacifica TaxID=1267423 RepID=UPI003BB08D4E
MNIAFHHILINQNGIAHSPPLGVLTLKKILEDKGYTCSFNQFLHVKGQYLDPKLLAEQILDTHGAAAISTMINGLPLLIMALRLVKQQAPNKTVIVGGPGFTGVAEEAANKFADIDVVCFGEGEKQVVEIAEWLHKKRQIQDVSGICYRIEGKVKKTPQAERIVALDKIPYLSLNNIDLAAYTGYPVMSSRGCPYKCSFCDVAPSWGRRNTRRSVDHVLDELDYLYYKVGLRDIAFVDDLFIINRKWVEEFCEKKLARGNKMTWRANGHINLSNEKLIALMADAGCKSMFYGVESGSNYVLKKIVKQFTIEKATSILQMTQRYMKTNLNLIWGYPFEKTEDLEATLKYHRFFQQKGLNCSLVMLAPLQSAPITEEFQELILNFKYPNIFIQDYYELKAEFSQQFESLLQSDPKVFSAFYSFSSPNLASHAKVVDHYRHSLQSSNAYLTPRELWQEV